MNLHAQPCCMVFPLESARFSTLRLRMSPSAVDARTEVLPQSTSCPLPGALTKHDEPIGDCTQSLLAAELTFSDGIDVVICLTLGNSPHSPAEKC